MNIILSLILMSLFLLPGCSTQKSWVYAPDSFQQHPPISQKHAIVKPFDDLRRNENSNKLFLYLIPLMPYGWADFSVPEGSQGHLSTGLWLNYKPVEDYAKALASELQNARIFAETHFSYGQNDADIVVQGKILNTDYSAKMISYGLSVYGPMLWYFGLPAGTVSNNLAIELSCIDLSANKILFTKQYSVPAYEAWVFLYDLTNDFNYAEMLKNTYRQFMIDLKSHAANGMASGLKQAGY